MSDSALEGRVKTLEEVAVKIFELILNLVTSLIVLGICLATLAICWFFGVTSDNAVLYFKELANTPIWLMLLAVVGFFGISYWSILKALYKLLWNYYWDNVVLGFLKSLK